MSKNSEKLLKLGMIAKKILENNKGILAADESPTSIQKRFDKVGITNSEDTRRKFRQMLFSSKGIEKYIGGVILHEETFDQKDEKGNCLIDLLKNKEICLGIKLDKGLIDFKTNEKMSVGLEDLHLRIKKFASKGAVFAKWRSLFLIAEDIPSEECILENCNVLAEYAKICQDNELVPIVEPEIYLEGLYSIEDGEKHSKRVLSTLIQRLNAYDVYIPGVLIKMSFVTQGKQEKLLCKPKEVGIRTIGVLISTIPCGIPGVVFLSGGHTQDKAIEYLDTLNRCRAHKTWSLSFSYGRCLSEEPMSIWKGKDENQNEAQEAFVKIAEKCYNASKGELNK
jgi:fructose-bisphosphate aldolase class I